MKKKQSGMAFHNVLMIVLIVGVLIKAGMALVPMFWGDMLLNKVFENMHSDPRISEKTSPKEFKRILEDRMRQNDISSIPLDGLLFSKGPGVLRVELSYQLANAFIGPVSFAANFSHSEEYQ